VAGELADSQLAVRWLRSMSARVGLDPERVCAWGDSAGGQLAAFLGVQRTSVGDTSAALYADQAPYVQCVVAHSAPYDLKTITASFQNIVAPYLFGAAANVMEPPSYGAASPALRVTSESAPMLLVHGRNDRVVPFSQAEEMADTLRSKGVAVTLLPYDGGHVGAGMTHEENSRIFRQEVDYLKARLQP
jgi:acetyl esterase/lipase